VHPKHNWFMSAALSAARAAHSGVQASVNRWSASPANDRYGMVTGPVIATGSEWDSACSVEAPVPGNPKPWSHQVRRNRRHNMGRVCNSGAAG